MSSTNFEQPRRERIGAFETLDGASLAVCHLVELHYDPDHVAIAPQDFVVVEPCRLRDRIRRVGSRAALLCAAVTASIGFAWSVEPAAFLRLLVAALAAAAIGVCIGLVVAVVEHRRSRFLRGRASTQVRPETFEVVVDREAARARHDLARWWDPSAPPIQERQAA